MKKAFGHSGKYVCRSTAHYAVSLDNDLPKIAHFGIDSGGRSRRPFDVNLLKPGLGGYVPLWANYKESGFKTTHSEHESIYTCLAGPYSGNLKITFTDDRDVVCNFKFNNAISGDIIAFSFATDTAPPTLWAVPNPLPPPDPARRKNPTVRNSYNMPASIHFPDYGLISFAGSPSQLQCREEFSQLKEMKGLCLGYRNTGLHNSMVAYHHGCVRVFISAKKPTRQVKFTLRIEPEVFPRIANKDLLAPKWNGLKRCWLNSFTLEKKTLTMGDNIALHGIAHLSMHFKSDLLFFTPPIPGNIRIQDYLRRALEIAFSKAVNITGEIGWDFLNPAKRGENRYAAFFDTTPSVLLAFANSYLEDANKAFGKKHSKTVAKAARFLISLDSDNDGIIESPFHGNKFEEIPGGRTRNWWDNFAFGHKDIYFNLLCHRALRMLVHVFQNLNIEPETRKAIEHFLNRFDAAFDKTFFNPKTGVYAGWISRDGKVHDYYFTFASAMAINEGLVKKTKARRILRILLNKIKEAGFGDCRYGIPGPAIPVALNDTIDWDFMGAWPRYENGGLCGQTAYHFLQALYKTGLRKEADAILFRMLKTFEEEPTHSGLMPGYMKSVDWRMMDGKPCGYNYLADNYYFLLAAITGHYGITLPGQK